MKIKQLRAADDSDELVLSLFFSSSMTLAQADGACRTTGSQGQQAPCGPRPATLTDHTTGVVCAPRVSFSLRGRGRLAGGFTGLFSPRGTVPVPNRSTSATCRFRRGGQGGALLLFSLRLSRTHLIGPGDWLSVGPL